MKLTEGFGAILSGRMTFLKKLNARDELDGVEGCGTHLSWLRCLGHPGGMSSGMLWAL